MILIGKTCAGKDLIAKNLAIKHGFQRVVTYTTRPRRNGEKEGIDYHFITEDEFLEKINEGFFAEYRSYNASGGKWYYGSSIESYESIKDDENYIVILNPDGYRNFLERVFVKHKSFYIYANNRTIVNRLKKRKDKNDSIQRRIKSDDEDFRGLEGKVHKVIYNNDELNINEVVGNILQHMEVDEYQ